jgi:hypothetical membrane protein
MVEPARALVVVGAVTSALFFVVLLVKGALRSGYDPTYHTGSELSLGDRGWLQIANFVVFGAGMLCFAIGIGRALGSLLGAALLGVFGVALIAAGVFVPDPLRGYPPGSGLPDEVTWHH